MAISGNIKTMVLAELLQWLSQGQKTGTLVIDGGKVEKRVFFENGGIISSASTDPTEYLGRFLINQGFITEEQLSEALAQKDAEKTVLGEILVDLGACTEDQLRGMLQLKAEESIYDIFTWEEGEFEFLDGEMPAESSIRMQLDVQWIVLEGSRRVDEWIRIRESVPSEQAVPVLICDPESLDIDEVDKRILAWIDDDRTVEEISKGAEVNLFMISQTLAQYVQQGVLKVVRPRVIEVEVLVPAAEGAAAAAGEPPAMAAQMPQGYPQMMPGQMPPMVSPGMQGYSPQMAQQYEAPRDGQPTYQPQRPADVDVGGRTLHFAGTDGSIAPPPPGAPLPAAPLPAAPPPAKAASGAENLLELAEQSLRLGDLHDALRSFRKAKTAQGAGPEVDKAIEEEGEKRVAQALDQAGIDLKSVPKLRCGMEDLTQLDISPQEGFVLTRIDGSYDLQSILKMSPMAKIDAQILFWKLRKSGHVAV